MKLLDNLLGKIGLARALPPSVTDDSFPLGNQSAATGLDKVLGRGFVGFSNYFEALRNSPDRSRVTEWQNPLAWAGVGSDYSRIRLSRISRALYDNGGFTSYAVDQGSLYAAPVLPQAATDDSAWNDFAEELFFEWAKTADYYQRPGMDLVALERLLCCAMDLDGDSGVMVVGEDGEVPKVQVVDGHRIVTPSDVKGNVLDGIRLDAKGRVQSFFVGAVNSEWLLDDPEQFVEVPAGQMHLVGEFVVTSPLRGISPLRRGLNDIRDARDIMAMEKLAVKVQTSMPGIIEGGMLDDASGFNLSNTDNDPAADATKGVKKVGRADLTGGDIPTLQPGLSFKQLTPGRPNATFDSFQSLLVGSFVAGLGIPPAFFLDEKMTGPGWRAIIGKAQRRFNAKAEAMERAVQFIWNRVIQWHVATGRLRPHPQWQRVTMQRQPQISIDLGDESQSDRDDITALVKTRQEVWGKRGRDWQTGTRQSFKELRFIIEEAKSVATETGVPLEIILAKAGLQPPQNQTPEQAKQQGKDGQKGKP